jgi:hypothetical protein
LRSDFNAIHNTVIRASERDNLGVSVRVEEVSIMTPCFMNAVDITGGAIENGTLIYGGTTWSSGHYAVAPENSTKISSYEVLDDLVNYYMDRTTFPNLNVSVIALFFVVILEVLPLMVS